jgi:hypothetical protein
LSTLVELCTRQTPLGQATESPDGSKHTKSAATDDEEYNRSENGFHIDIGTNERTKH